MLTWLLREAPGLQKVISSRDYGFCVLSQRRFVFVQLAELLPAGRGGWVCIVPCPKDTPSHRPDQGLGGVTAISALAHGCGSSPHLQGIDSSIDCLQMSLLLLWAPCPAYFPAYLNLPILAPWGFSSTALRKLLVALVLFKWRLSHHKHLIYSFPFSG